MTTSLKSSITLHRNAKNVAGISKQKESVCNSRKRQPIPIPTPSFRRKPLIQQPLIRTVKASIPSNNSTDTTTLHQSHHPLEILLPRPRSENHHSRVKTIWPAGIWAGGEPVREEKEVCERAEGEDVGVEVDEFVVEVGETEDVEFG